MKRKNNNLRLDFPVLSEKFQGNEIIYLDNAATSLTPMSVIIKISEYYYKYSSNIHRGSYITSMIVSDLYENTRLDVCRYIGAKNSSDIIFTKGATESINLVASSFVDDQMSMSDEILITIMEHHANIVPWQELCRKKGCSLKYIYLNKSTDIDINNLLLKITKKTKFVSLSHVSNVLGTVNPIKFLSLYARIKKKIIMVDGSQAISHIKVDISSINPDFYVFSGHKCYGPTGIGVLYIKENLIDMMKPYQTGGGGVLSVNLKNTDFADAPQRFEVGTPNISGVIGFKESIQYINRASIETISSFERSVMLYTENMLSNVKSVATINFPQKRIGIFPLKISNIHPHDVSTILDREGIAVRGGFLCAEPLLNYLRTGPVTRVSLSFYNNNDEIDKLKNSLEKLIRIFAYDNTRNK